MIKLKDILNEAVYGNIATVYHRTGIEDLVNRVYTSGFIPGAKAGARAIMGKGMYACYDLASQENDQMADQYGKTIVKFVVDLTGFFFFDWEEFMKNPLHKEKLPKSTKETFIQDQIQYYKIVVEDDADTLYHFYYTSSSAYRWVYNIIIRSDMSKKVSGIVYSGQPDGKVLLCYDTKRLRPVAFKKDGDKEFTKVNSTKDFIKKTSLYTVSESNSESMYYNGGFEQLQPKQEPRTQRYSDFEKWKILAMQIGAVVKDRGDDYIAEMPDKTKLGTFSKINQMGTLHLYA
jgi:hypothetical protein